MGKIIGEGITFDDVLLVPQYSEVTPNMIDLSTQLTKNIKLNIPLMSAGMDTVTEHRMAIAMARQGGIGIIHKNMSVEAQAEEVDKVKRSENGVITDPFFLHPDNTLQEANDLMGKFRISGVPITDDNGKLVGIITNRDLKFEEHFERPIKECMTSENLITAPVGTTLEEAKKILGKARKEKLPIVDDDYKLRGLITIKDIEKSVKYPSSAHDSQGRLLAGAAVGITANVMDRVQALVNSSVDCIVIDSAHGHSKNIITTLKNIKSAFPDLQVIAGNIATGAAAKALCEAGVDAVKVGMLSSEICMKTVAEKLRQYKPKYTVIDPVMVAKGGHALMKPEALEALKTEVIPLAYVLTPNIPEAETITEMSIESQEDVQEAAKKIYSLGAKNVLIKGGHLSGDAIDLLYDGKSFYTFTTERINTKNTHGTGCTFSSAIAANLANGLTLNKAVEKAKTYITTAIEHSLSIGKGHGPTNHFYELYMKGLQL